MPKITREVSVPPRPFEPLDTTHKLISAFYLHLNVLSALLPPGIETDDDDEAFRMLLDGTMVASAEPVKLEVDDGRHDSITMGEVMEQVQQRLFSAHALTRVGVKYVAGSYSSSTPSNVLTLGYKLAMGIDSRNCSGRGYLPLVPSFPNTVVAALCSSPTWNKLLLRMGPGCILKLLTSPSTALFTPLPNACYLQISGQAISDLTPRTSILGEVSEPLALPSLPQRRDGARARKRKRKEQKFEDAVEDQVKPLLPKRPRVPGPPIVVPIPTSIPIQSPNSIEFERRKMYHCRPVKNNRMKVIYGFSPKHIFSRLADVGPATTKEDILAINSRRVLKYIFPRQFGLHNVFTSPLAKSWVLKVDYEDREAEIETLGAIRTPKRLRPALELTKLMLDLRGKVNIRKLLDRHCPSSMNLDILTEADRSAMMEMMGEPQTQASRGELSIDVSHPSLIVPHGAEEAAERVKSKPRFAEYMCSAHEVVAFMRAVVQEIIPRDFWGSKANSDLILGYMTSYLRMRRWETFTLHTVLQKFRVESCDWLRSDSSSKASNVNQKPNAVEMSKRREILAEFLYWFFDSFVMDIAKTAFTITESAAYRNRTLFFRQDDWNLICKPLLEDLRSKQFQGLSTDEADEVLNNRALGFSFVRVLPKDTGFRPIVNLKRRAMVIGPRGRPELGKSINKILGNIAHVLNFEASRKSELLGASMSTPDEIYGAIKAFKASLVKPGQKLPKFYFVKVDVRGCFDTIEQDKLLDILADILLEEKYRIHSYSRVMPAAGRVAKKWPSMACPDTTALSFVEFAGKVADGLRSAVMSDKVAYAMAERDDIKQLLHEHIKNNIVKIGGQYCRQQVGIPQGSVLSSLLCNLFYGHMERTVLQFTDDPSTALLRYVDDFLLITTDRDVAVQFLRVMDAGIPEYGCFIASEKRLTSFPISLNPAEVVPSSTSKDFPWCGKVINTVSLDVKADISRYEEVATSDTLTVQFARNPGQAFLTKLLQATKDRSHIIYNDTTHNSTTTVYLNIYQSFLRVALKFQSYVQEWGTDPRKRPAFFLRVIERVVQFAYVVIRNRSRTIQARLLGAESKIDRSWVLWLGKHAFQRVLQRTPTQYREVLKSLSRDVKSKTSTTARMRLRRVVHAAGNEFADKRR